MEEIKTTLNEKIGEIKEEFEYEPSKKEREVVGDIFSRFTLSSQERNLNYAYFDNRNLIDFIDDSVNRFITNKDEREDIEDWQARVFDPFTRNKVIAILGKIAQYVPKPEFIGVGDEDFLRSQILGDLTSYSDRVDDTEELMFYALLEAAVKGTVVGYEGYEEKTKKIRDIKSYDSGNKIVLIEGELKIRKVFGSIVPLEEFYPSSVGIRKIKDMPFCFWRTVYEESQFKMKFSQYDKTKLVKPYFLVKESEDSQRPFYLDYISPNVSEGSVEVIRYYNQDTDEFVITANGIWLNPLEEENIMPIPFIHKTLPFWKAIYEPFGADFFYGKSLPDKLKSMQDVINVLHNMLLDQSFLSIFPPILTDNMDEIEDDFLRPGRRIPVTDQSKYRELEISAPQNFHQYILEYTKRVLEETSVDAVNQGVSGTGDRVTATEIRRAAQSVTSILGLFVQFMTWGVRDKSRLRAKNILQFYTTPLMERVLGEGASKDVASAFNVFKIDDTVLTSGKRGTKIIEMFPSREAMPTKLGIRTQAKLLEKETGKNVEKIAINPDYIRDFEFDVKLIPNTSGAESKELQKALFMEFTKMSMELFPDMIDRENLFAEAIVLFGFRPEKFMKKPEPQNQEMMGGEQTGAGNMGVGENLIRGMMGNRQMGVRDMIKAG